MKKILLILATAFIINPQSTYDIPYGTTNLLVLDVTLSEQVSAIKLHNTGTLDHTMIAKLMIWEDGPSAGWNGDENSLVNVTQAPFFDTEIVGDFKQRIFVTLDLQSNYISEQTIQLQLEESSSGAKITGLKRTVRHDASSPTTPVSPLASRGEALSASAIRWHFIDLSNNEFGFKVLDTNLKEVAIKEETDLSYLDETGLSPDTEYSGRKVVAFNDRGESPTSASSVFPSARTLALPVVEIIEEPVSVPLSGTTAGKEEVAPAPTLFETIQTKIADIQRQISEFIKQLDELIKQSSATIFGALRGFLRAFFGK